MSIPEMINTALNQMSAAEPKKDMREVIIKTIIATAVRTADTSLLLEILKYDDAYKQQKGIDKKSDENKKHRSQ
jgi:hypothetical protein